MGLNFKRPQGQKFVCFLLLYMSLLLIVLYRYYVIIAGFDKKRDYKSFHPFLFYWWVIETCYLFYFQKGFLIILWWDHSVVWWRTFSYLFVVSKINSTEWVHNFNLPMIHPYFNGLLMSISRKWDILFNGKRVERGLENILNVYFSSLFRCVFSLELIVTMAFCAIPTDFLYRLWFSS